MPIRFFNTYSRQTEEFVPLEPGRVRLYTCGPTVYNFAHIGNFRAYVFEDLLQRHLEFRGYEVRRVMNLTDVDDKTIRGCRAAAIPLAAFTKPFKTAFFEDIKTLRIRPAGEYPEATAADHIARMISMIATLMEKGHAYRADDGSVYFRIRSFAAYGKLAHIVLDDLQPGTRVSSDEYEKENVGDFALWKAWDAADGDVGWESPWGRGRPGWHIECSAMATGILGPRLDIHCGGEDNIFPHHEDEIAQSEGATGKPFVKFWLHGAHLLVESKKMSKRLGNYFTLRDLVAKGFTGREVRYLLLTAHYRETFNFTLDGLTGAKSALARIDECVGKLRERAAEMLALEKNPGQNTGVSLLPAFTAALEDDLNISAAWGAVFEWVREINRRLAEHSLSPTAAETALLEWNKVDAVLGIGARNDIEIPAEILALAEARTAAKQTKDFKRADAIRDELKAKGWVIEDSPKGIKLKKL